MEGAKTALHPCDRAVQNRNSSLEVRRSAAKNSSGKFGAGCEKG